MPQRASLFGMCPWSLAFSLRPSTLTLTAIRQLLEAVLLDGDGLRADYLVIDRDLHQVGARRERGTAEAAAATAAATLLRRSRGRRRGTILASGALLAGRRRVGRRVLRRRLHRRCGCDRLLGLAGPAARCAALRCAAAQVPADAVQAGVLRPVDRPHFTAGDVRDADAHVVRVALQPVVDRRARIGI